MLNIKTNKKKKKNRWYRYFFLTFIMTTIIVIGCFYFFNISSNSYCRYMQVYGNNKNIKIKSLRTNLNEMEKNLDIQEPDYVWAEGLYDLNNPNILIYHHAAIKKASAEKIHQIHLDKDYGGIGYHFYITKDGKIYRGRPENAVGAHTIGKNKESLGICLEGNYEEESMSESQVKSLEKLSTYLIIKYNLEGVYTHKDFYKTACPGKNFELDRVKTEITDSIIEIHENSGK